MVDLQRVQFPKEPPFHVGPSPGPLIVQFGRLAI